MSLFRARRASFVAVLAGLLLGGPAVGSAVAATATPVAGGVLPAPNGAAGTDEVDAVVVNGVPRTYRLFVPTKLPATNAKLVIAMHPLNGTAAGFETNSNLDIGAGQLGALVAYPAGFENSWNAGTCCGYAQKTNIDDVAFIDAVIKDVEARFDVDTAHVSMGGFSNGSLMTYRYICERSETVHIAFIGSGALVAPDCSFTQPVQVLHMHGMKDATVPWQGTTSSKYTTDGVMPSVMSTVNRIAAADGCATRWIGSAVNTLLNKYVPATCPAGASVLVYKSAPLMHGWVSDKNAAAVYGINETNATWSFLANAWKTG